MPCKVAAKFDDGAVENFSTTPSDGHAMDKMAWIANANGFLAKLRKAKTLTIEVPILGKGREQKRFNVYPLDGWDGWIADRRPRP